MFTDFLGNPISEGDTVVYAASTGVLGHSEIAKLIPLVPHPNPSHYGYAQNVPQYAREDQLNQASPTRFTGKQYEDPAKRYVVQVWKERRVGWGQNAHMRRQRFSLSTQHVVRVPA